MTPRGCRLVVNADDLGLSAGVNRGVMRAHAAGIVTSASLMPCGAAFDDAVTLARAHPRLDLGVHLVLVGERPLLGSARVPTLVGGDGRFHPTARAFLARYLLGRIDRGELRAELAAQLARAHAAGVTPSHVDSHQHLHLLAGIWEVVGGLAQRHGIRWMRRPCESLAARGLRDPIAPVRFLEHAVLNRLCRARAAPAGVALTDAFGGFQCSGHLTERRLARLLRRLPRRGVAELMCHPGEAEPGGPADAWGYHPEVELAALESPRTARLVQALELELTSFAALSAPAPRAAPRA